MKKFIIQFLLLMIVIFLALIFYTGKITSIPFLPQPQRFAQVTVGDAKIKAEIADTAEKRKKGLGGRGNLATDSGMLFVFQKADIYPFWMKGLNFPLDFIWIKGDKIVGILKNIQPPAPGTKDDSLPIYKPNEEMDKVLEINGGVADKLQIKVGDKIRTQ